MINVNQITSRLASMPDQALQQYAAMHKNDPYVMALALSESNRRKQIRQGAQMQAPQQPKVVDQELAQMSQPMPEDTGIGQLPAPNMQNMAEGGIVAFEGGGEVPRMFNGGVPPRPVQRMPGDPVAAEWDRMYGATYAPDGTPKASKQQYVLDPASKSYVLNPQYVAPTKPAPAPAPAPAASGAAPPPLPPPPPPPPPPPDKKPPPVPAAKPAAGLPALNTKPMSAEDAAKESAKLGDDKNIRTEMEDYVKRQKQVGEDAVGSFKEGIAALPEAYKKYEERLQKEETEAATDKDKAMGMSIFKAGLAMMAGTSQNAFENIGKGALVGLDDYQTALKDFKKAQRERDKAFADIEQARLADQRGDLKTKLELENRAADRNSAAEGKMVDGIASLFKTNKENALGIYKTGTEQLNQNLRSMYEQGEQTKRTIIQANAPTGLERIYRDPVLYKKHIDAQTAATGMRGDTAIRESWAKSPYLQSQYPNVEDYVRMMAGSSGNAGGEFKVLGSRPSAP